MKVEARSRTSSISGKVAFAALVLVVVPQALRARRRKFSFATLALFVCLAALPWTATYALAIPPEDIPGNACDAPPCGNAWGHDKGEDGEEQPTEEDPVEQDPIEQDPVEQDPIEQDPVEQDPIEDDPVEQDPIEEDPVEQDPIEDPSEHPDDAGGDVPTGGNEPSGPTVGIGPNKAHFVGGKNKTTTSGDTSFSGSEPGAQAAVDPVDPVDAVVQESPSLTVIRKDPTTRAAHRARPSTTAPISWREAFPYDGPASTEEVAVHARKVVATVGLNLIDSATKVARDMAFPLGLALMVIIFLMIQNRIDRNDPKLAAAEITAAQETLSFT